jgi:hydrogenase large subunit
MSNILHFYHLTALDYINTAYSGCPISGQAPWWPKDNTADMLGGTTATSLITDYVEALNIRRECHRLGAYASGKQPCQAALIPGGVTKVVSSDMKTTMQGLLTTIRNFIDSTYVPDVAAVAANFGHLLHGNVAKGSGDGCKMYVAYGTFPNSAGGSLICSGFLNATAGTVGGWLTASNPSNDIPLDPSKIKEFIKYSRYDEGGGGSNYDGLHPSVGVTKPSYGKAGAYSFLKAPRYCTGTTTATTHVAEVGPLARVLVNYAANNQQWRAKTSWFMSQLGGLTTTSIPALRSVIGRHGARALETKVIADAMTGWINALSTTATTGETYRHRNIPRTSSTGFGMTEAPRGALGHWMRVDGRKISGYQCVVPSTWNLGPKDSFDQLGPVEQSINGAVATDDASGRTKIGRIIRSFDPCIACAVHLVSPDKKKVSKFTVVDPEKR